MLPGPRWGGDERRAGSFQEVTRCSSKIIHGKNYFTMLLKPCMKSIKSSHLRGEKPGNVLYSRLKRWINYSDCCDTSTPPIRTTSIIWPITDPRFDSSSYVFDLFFFFKDTFIRPISVSFKRRNAPSLSSSCFERFSSNCRMKKCLEQIRCRISVWSWAAPQPRLSQRAWPAAAAEADMHRIYSTDNFSSPYKLPNSVRYLS